MKAIGINDVICWEIEERKGKEAEYDWPADCRIIQCVYWFDFALKRNDSIVGKPYQHLWKRYQPHHYPSIPTFFVLLFLLTTVIGRAPCNLHLYLSIIIWWLSRSQKSSTLRKWRCRRNSRSKSKCPRMLRYVATSMRLPIITRISSAFTQCCLLLSRLATSWFGCFLRPLDSAKKYDHLSSFPSFLKTRVIINFSKHLRPRPDLYLIFRL